MDKATARKKLAEFFKNFDFSDDRARKAVGTKIIRSVVTDIYNQDLVRLIGDVETFGPGEELQFGILDEVLAYIIEPGGYFPRSTMTKKVITLPRHRVAVSVALDIDQLSSGRYGGINDIRRKMTEALLGQRNKLVWDTLFASIVSGDANYSSFLSTASADAKKSVLDTAISYINDNTNSGPIAIVGRWSSLDWIEQIDGSKWFSDEARDTILTNSGYLGRYKGVPVIRLRSYKDRNEQQKINANHLMILSDGTVKFGQVTPGRRVDDRLNIVDNYEWTITMVEQYGCAILEPERNYHIEIL